jgi:hypothetical protein
LFDFAELEGYESTFGIQKYTSVQLILFEGSKCNFWHFLILGSLDSGMKAVDCNYQK